MTGSSAEFFEDLAQQGRVQLMQRVRGTLRFDLDRGNGVDHWFVAIDKGDLAVTRRNARADVIVHTDRALFDDIAGGRVNASAAALRGLLDIEGNIGLLMLFQRLFPGPPKGRTATAAAKGGRKRS